MGVSQEIFRLPTRIGLYPDEIAQSPPYWVYRVPKFPEISGCSPRHFLRPTPKSYPGIWQNDEAWAPSAHTSLESFRFPGRIGLYVDEIAQSPPWGCGTFYIFRNFRMFSHTLFATDPETPPLHMPKRRILHAQGGISQEIWRLPASIGLYFPESTQSPLLGVCSVPKFPAISGRYRHPFTEIPIIPADRDLL